MNRTTLTHDSKGREWAKLSEINEGDMVELDEGFTCVQSGRHTVRFDHDAAQRYGKANGLYVDCKDGHHFLKGQADDGDHCVGIYKALN